MTATGAGSGAPQFPFGFGLSYTTFGFSKLKVKNADDGGVDVSFSVKNTGSSRAGACRFSVRRRADVDLRRVGSARGASYWSDTAQQWVLDPSGRTMWVGDADATGSLPLSTTLKGGSGDISCSNQQFNATTINGNLTVPQGAWCDLVDVTVKGNVQLQRAAGIRIQNVTITGNLQAENTAGAADPLSANVNIICNSTIAGNVEIHNSASGAPWNIGGCGANTIGGNVHFHNNDANGNTIAANTVQGNLQCEQNGTLGGSGNTVVGKNQCPGVH